LLGPNDSFSLGDEQRGLDFESEVAVVLGDTPRGTTASDAALHIRLLLLANDWTFRNLIPAELAKGFGFFVSKPATAFSPFAVTPDELGAAYRDGRLHLPLKTRLNGALVGDPDAGAEMHFSFFELLAHVSQTRALTAGTILGSGTVSNADPARGVSCLAELRAREMIATGQPVTPFLRVGDQVEIAMFDDAGSNVFGTISERVVP
jgi:fumarylacetoacetate (FAA) hydrolase